MPTIPRYDSEVAPRVSQRKQSIQATPDAFGAAEGRAMQGVSSGLGLIAQRAEEVQNERDETAAREAFVSASGRLREAMRGENGYLTRQGEDAFEGYNDFSSEVDNIGGEHGQPLSQNARRIYDQLWASRREGALNSGATHATNQRNAHRQMVLEAQVDQHRNGAIEDAGMMSRAFTADGDVTTIFDQELEAGADAIRAGLASQGVTDATVVSNAVDSWRSETIRISIAATLDNGDTEGAERIFNSREQLLIGADRETARALIQQEGMREEMQAATSDIFAQFGTDTAAARRYIRANYSGEEEDNLLSRYNGRVSESRADREAVRQTSEREALEILDNGGGWDDLSSSQRASLDESLRVRLMQGRPLATSPQRYLDVVSMQPEELARVDLVDVWSWASESDYRRIEGMVRSAQTAEREGREVSRSDRVRVQSQSAAVARIATLNGVTDEDEVYRLMTDLQQAVDERETQSGEPMTQAEFEEFVDDYTREVIFDRPLGGSQVALQSAPGPAGMLARVFTPGQEEVRASTALSQDTAALNFAQQEHRQAVVLAASAIAREYPNLEGEVDVVTLNRIYREVIDNAAPGTITPWYIERTMLRLYARDVDRRADDLRSAIEREEEG